MSIKEQLNNDIKDAMRARDKAKLSTLRLISAAIKQVEVDERIAVGDERLLAILDKLVKQRRESIAQFQSAGRDDLVAQEQAELEYIRLYLPEPLSDSQIEASIIKAIADAGAEKISDLGKVMALLKPQLQGRADMAKVSALTKAKLS